MPYLLQDLDQLDVFIAKAEMMIEAERTPIGRAGTECENPIALIARPLLACYDERCANSTSSGHVAILTWEPGFTAC